MPYCGRGTYLFEDKKDKKDNFSFLRVHCPSCPSCLPIFTRWGLGRSPCACRFCSACPSRHRQTASWPARRFEDHQLGYQPRSCAYRCSSCRCLPREVSATDIHLLTVKHQHLEVNSGTQHPFQPVIQHGIPVKVLPEVRPRLLSMNQPHLNTPPNQQSDNRQKRLSLITHLHIQVLNVGRPNPQAALHIRHPCQHLVIMLCSRNVFNHSIASCASLVNLIRSPCCVTFGSSSMWMQKNSSPPLFLCLLSRLFGLFCLLSRYISLL